MSKMIAVDGVDGSGKGANLEAIEAWLKEHGLSVRTMSCPFNDGLPGILRRLALGQAVSGYDWGVGGGAINPLVHEVPDPLTIQHLITTAWIYTYRNIVLPLLDEYDVVLLDRSHFISSYVYGLCDGLSLLDVMRMQDTLKHYSREPDAIVILDVPYRVAQQRLITRREEGGETNHYDVVSAEAFERRRQAYHDIAREYAQSVIIDASGTQETVAAMAIACIRPVVGI